MRRLKTIVDAATDRGWSERKMRAWLARHALRRHAEDIVEIDALIQSLSELRQSPAMRAAMLWLASERRRHIEAHDAAARACPPGVIDDTPDEAWARET